MINLMLTLQVLKKQMIHFEMLGCISKIHNLRGIIAI